MTSQSENIERFKASFESWAAMKELAQTNRVLAIAILSLAKGEPDEALLDIKAFQDHLTKVEEHLERLFQAHEALYLASR